MASDGHASWRLVVGNFLHHQGYLKKICKIHVEISRKSRQISEKLPAGTNGLVYYRLKWTLRLHFSEFRNLAVSISFLCSEIPFFLDLNMQFKKLNSHL